MSPRPRGPSSTPCTARGWSASSPSWTRRTSPRSAWRFASAWSGGRAHHGVLRRRDRALPLHPSPRSADGPAARGVGAAPGGGVRPPAVRRGLLSPSHQEGPRSGRDRRDGTGGRVRGGAAPCARRSERPVSGSHPRCRDGAAGLGCVERAGRDGAAHSTGTGWRWIGGIMRKRPGVQHR